MFIVALLFAGASSTELFSKARTNDDDITPLELDALILRYGFYVLDGDTMCFERTILDALLISPSFIVDQYTASYQAASRVPVIESGKLLILVFLAERLIQVFDAWLSVKHQYFTVIVAVPHLRIQLTYTPL